MKSPLVAPTGISNLVENLHRRAYDFHTVTHSVTQSMNTA